MSEYRPIGTNPYVVGSAVRDGAMFFGREEDFEFVREHLVPAEKAQGALVVLCGGRRSGKTSFLFRILDGRLGDAVFPVLLDLQAMADCRSTPDLWRFFTTAILERMREAAVPVEEAEKEIPESQERTPNERLRRFVAAVTRALGDRRLLLLVDEYEVLERLVHAGGLGPETIDGLAALLDAGLPVSMVLAGAYGLDRRDPEVWGRLASRSVQRRLSFLRPAAAERLVTEPVAGRVTYDDGVVPAILRATAGQPYLLQVLCGAIVERLVEEERNRCTLEDLEEAHEAAIEQALPQLALWWRSLGFLGRVVASVVASLIEDPGAGVPPETAEESLAKDQPSFGFEVTRSALRGALEALVESEDLERDATGAYRFRADMLRRWVAAGHPVWEVIRSIADEPEVPADSGVRRRRRLRRGHLVWLAIIGAAAVIGGIRLWFPVEESLPETGPGAPSWEGGEAFSRGWHLGPDAVPVPDRTEDVATIRAEEGRLVAFRTRAGGSGYEMAVTWPLGAPPPLDGWTEALARPEESWLWGIVPALAPHPGWLAAADRRLGPDEEPPVDGMPAWIADLLLPAARIEVDYDRGFPARVRIADRTGWARSEWCVEPGAWVRCGDARTSGKVGRIEFDFVPLGRAKEPLLAGVRFLDDKGVPAADFLGRTALTFLYRDVDPDAEVDRWVVEMSIETLARRRRSHGVSADAPSATGDRRVLFYFRRDRDPGAGTRGGEIAAVRAHDHVGRPVPFGYDWGPMVSGIYLQGGRGGREVLFFDVANQQTPDAAGAMGYREEFGGDGLRTRLTFLDVDRGCLATSRTERDAAVEYCEIALFGDPAVRPVPFPDPAMPSGPYALAWRTPHGPGRNADGVSSFALRDLGAAAPPCSSLMVVQHHDAAGALASPARGPFLGTAASRLGLRFRDGRFSDVVRTDCFDGPCADRDVMDETWSCDRNGCVFSTIPLDCTPPAPTP